MKHCCNDKECIAWSYDNKITKPNSKILAEAQNFPKTWKPRSKCMNYEKMRGFRSHTKGFNLKWVEILMGRRILVKRKSLDRERREKDPDIWVKSKSGWTSCIYRNRHLDRSIKYQGGVENKSLIDREVLRRYRWQNYLNRSRRYWASIS